MCTGILKPGTEMRHGAFIHVDTHTCTLVFINGAGIVHFICTGILKPGTQTRHTNQTHKPGTQTGHTRTAFQRTMYQYNQIQS